jgi:uncharacterized membrane protein YphA (DoxX/SURF4 family)
MRATALALLGMTAVIQIFVYPSAWPTHLVRATALVYLAGRGAGRPSLDHRLGLAQTVRVAHTPLAALPITFLSRFL